MNILVVTIWVLLGALGYVTAHAVIERLLFHVGCRVAGRLELDQFCAKLRDSRSLDFANNRHWSSNRGWTLWLFAFLNRDQLGWLGPLVHQAKLVSVANAQNRDATC